MCSTCAFMHAQISALVHVWANVCAEQAGWACASVWSPHMLCVCVCVSLCVKACALALNARCSSWSRPCSVPASTNRPVVPPVLFYWWQPPSTDSSPALKGLSAPSSTARHNTIELLYIVYTLGKSLQHSCLSFFFFFVLNSYCLLSRLLCSAQCGCLIIISLPNKRSPAWLCDVSQGGSPEGKACSLMWKFVVIVTWSRSHSLPE